MNHPGTRRVCLATRFNVTGPALLNKFCDRQFLDYNSFRIYLEYLQLRNIKSPMLLRNERKKEKKRE